MAPKTETLTISDHISASLSDVANGLQLLQLRMRALGDVKALEEVERFAEEMKDSATEMTRDAGRSGAITHNAITQFAESMLAVGGGMKLFHEATRAVRVAFGSLSSTEKVVVGVGAPLLAAIGDVIRNLLNLSDKLTGTWQQTYNLQLELGNMSLRELADLHHLGAMMARSSSETDAIWKRLIDLSRDVSQVYSSELYGILQHHNQSMDIFYEILDMKQHGVDLPTIAKRLAERVAGRSEQFQREFARESGIPYSFIHRYLDAAHDVLPSPGPTPEQQKALDEGMRRLKAITNDIDWRLQDAMNKGWFRLQKELLPILVPMEEGLAKIARALSERTIKWVSQMMPPLSQLDRNLEALDRLFDKIISSKPEAEKKPTSASPTSFQSNEPLEGFKDSKQQSKEYLQEIRDILERRREGAGATPRLVGGPVSAGEAYKVGEAGAETFAPNDGGAPRVVGAGGSQLFVPPKSGIIKPGMKFESDEFGGAGTRRIPYQDWKALQRRRGEIRGPSYDVDKDFVPGKTSASGEGSLPLPGKLKDIERQMEEDAKKQGADKSKAERRGDEIEPQKIAETVPGTDNKGTMLILRGISGTYGGVKYTRGALDERSAKAYAEALGYAPQVLDVSGETGPQSAQTRAALAAIRGDPNIHGLLGFSGGGYNTAHIIAQLTPAERERLKQLTVLGAPNNPESRYRGPWNLTYRKDPPAGHMAGPAALLEETLAHRQSGPAAAPAEPKSQDPAAAPAEPKSQDRLPSSGDGSQKNQDRFPLRNDAERTIPAPSLVGESGTGAASGRSQPRPSANLSETYEPTESTIYYTGAKGQKSVTYKDPETGGTYTDRTPPIGPAASGLPDYVPGIAFGYRNFPRHGDETLGGYYVVIPKEGPNAGQVFVLPHSDKGPGAGHGEKLDYNAPASQMVFNSMREGAQQGGAYLKFIGRDLPEDVGIGKQPFPEDASRKYGLPDKASELINSKFLGKSSSRRDAAETKTGEQLTHEIMLSAQQDSENNRSAIDRSVGGGGPPKGKLEIKVSSARPSKISARSQGTFEDDTKISQTRSVDRRSGSDRSDDGDGAQVP